MLKDSHVVKFKSPATEDHNITNTQNSQCRVLQAP